MIELHGIINEVESLRGFVSSGVDYYKGDKGDQGEKGDKGDCGAGVWLTNYDGIRPPNNLCPNRKMTGRTDGRKPEIGDLVIDTNTFNLYCVNTVNNIYVLMDYIGCLKGANGDTGYIFTPSVSNSGVISWSNNGELENPASVDLVAAVIAALPSAVGVNF